MRPMTRSLLVAAVLAVLPLAANAESTTVTTGSATGHLDFQVTIPRVLMLQVGSTGSTINSIDFDIAWRQSRYDKEGPGGDKAAYVNCPMDQVQYEAFINALTPPHNTACSPNRSVSVSSAKVVSMMPARAHPMPRP